MLHHTTVACAVVARSGSTRWMGMIGRLLLAYHYCKGESELRAPTTVQVVVAAARCLLLVVVGGCRASFQLYFVIFI